MKATIKTADYVVLGITVFSSAFIGLYYAIKERRQTSMFRYHLGDGKLKALPVALSMLVTFESSIFFLGYPAEIYVHGTMYWLANIGMSIGFCNLLWTSIPLFYPLKITSIYEYLEIRFGAADIRRLATFLSCLSMVLYAGVVLYGAGTALESVTNIPTWSFIIAMTSIAVIYTALGGLKAVVATDVIQGIIMLTAIFAVVIKGTIEVGGMAKVFDLNNQSGRMQLVDFDPNPMVRHTFWTLVVGGSIRSLALSFKQPAVQRLKSTSSTTEAKKVVLMSIPSFVILQLFVMYEGLVAYAYFAKKGCDPLASGAISNPNQVISYTVMEMFQNVSGLTGLFLGALGSASLSTISSLLNSISAVISEDVVKPFWKGATDAGLTRISKFIVLITGVVCGSVAILIGQTTGPLTQIAASIIGSVDAPLTAMFMMAVYVPFANRKGLMTGAIVGLIFGVWISGGYNFSKGRKVTPWLPLGPTDQCPDPNLGELLSNSTLNSSAISPLLDADMKQILNSSTYQNLATSLIGQVGTTTQLSPTPVTEQVITGIDNLYSISYIYIATMIIFVTTLVGLTVSKLTKPTKEEESVPANLVLSAREQFLSCFGKRKKTSELQLDTTKLNDM